MQMRMLSCYYKADSYYPSSVHIFHLERRRGCCRREVNELSVVGKVSLLAGDHGSSTSLLTDGHIEGFWLTRRRCRSELWRGGRGAGEEHGLQGERPVSQERRRSASAAHVGHWCSASPRASICGNGMSRGFDMQGMGGMDTT